jgi:hypothetical protein
MLDFFHCFNDCYGRETGFGPTDQSAGVQWVRTVALFSGAVDPFNYIDDYAKGCFVRIA